MVSGIGELYVIMKGIGSGMGSNIGRHFFEFVFEKSGTSDEESNDTDQNRLEHEGSALIERISENASNENEVVDALDGFEIMLEDGKKVYKKQKGPRF
jgi:hypothetical protein